MARCIDCLHYKVCEDWSKDCFGDESLFPYECDDSEILCENYTPTADVVPKSESLPLDVHEALKQHVVEEAKAEVAREIICEILLNHTPDIDGFFTIHKTELLKGE